MRFGRLWRVKICVGEGESRKVGERERGPEGEGGREMGASCMQAELGHGRALTVEGALQCEATGTCNCACGKCVS